MTGSARIGIITVSDRASRGEYADLGGPAIEAYLARVLTTPWEPDRTVVADDAPLIEDAIRTLAARERAWCSPPEAPARRRAT